MHGLEIEEVEDLISVSAVGGTNNRKRNNHGGLLLQCTDYVCDPNHRKRNLILSVVTAFLILLLVSSRGEKTASHKHLSDVIQKEPTMAPTPAPTQSKKEVEPAVVPKEAPKAPPPPPAPEPKKEEPAATPEPTKDEPAAATTTPPAPKKTSKIPELPLNHDHLPISDETKEQLTAKYGQWHFWDGDNDIRPKDDYCGKYPNRDIPGDDFPDTAWQVDAVYVNHYLNDAEKLISRAMEAIFEEYGHGKPLPPEGLAERIKMFHWEKVDLATVDRPPDKYAKRGARDNGGWTTKRSFEGLVRRLLHAMMTQDKFTVVMGGHSAASGAGNHFRQSYMMQFHVVMEPIFARLGVKLITRNMGQGGLGTVQAAMGMAGIYGDEIDLLLWDSGMTENMVPQHIDLYLRQGLLGGKRVPVLWGGNFELLRMLHNEADADVGEYGNGMLGIPTTMDEKQALTIPWAARFIKCDEERGDLCGTRFNATCWIDRPDGIKPAANQRDRPAGQVKWHPGWRVHQLQGRVLAFSLLEALQHAVNLWSEGTMAGQPLDDDYWHVTDYYENIRNKTRKLDPSLGSCYQIEDQLPTRMCSTPMKAKTQYTPRADPDQSSITSIMKPAPDGYIPKNELKPLYDGPDVHNPVFDVPPGEVDVVAIVMNRRRLDDVRVEHVAEEWSEERGTPIIQADSSQRRLEEDKIVPGKGWQIFGEPEGFCDGTYEAQCNRDTNNDCFLYGMHDARGAVIGTDKAGWMVMELKDVSEGIIVVKLHTWHYASENSRTQGWKTVNNEETEGRRRLGGVTFLGDADADTSNSSGERRLMRSYDTPELPGTFFFDYAIDGKITSLNATEFVAQKKQVQRVVETLTLLDNDKFNDGKAKDVEVAIRLRGCGDKCTFGVSHIYWA